MEYYKITFTPEYYGERALTVIVPFKSFDHLKQFYKGEAYKIIDVFKTTEEEYSLWLSTEAKKKKYQKIITKY